MPGFQRGHVHRPERRGPLADGGHLPAHKKEDAKKNGIQKKQNKTNNSHGEQKIGSHEVSD